MSTNKGEGFGNKPIVVILGLIASCIAIFAFITGKQSILDLIGTPVYKPTPKNTPVSTTVIPTSAIHAEDTTIPESPTQVVLMPTSLPMLIDNANLGVSISIQNLPNLNSGQGNVRIQFLTGNEPLRNYEILFMEASQDITGRWTIVEG